MWGGINHRSIKACCVPNRQRGQAIVLTLLLMVSTVLIGLALAKNAVFISDSMQMQNAADSAAFGVSTIEARDLNFIAYTNRAMTANETALGQLMGIASWAIMVRSIGPTLGDYLEPLLNLMELISFRLARPLTEATRLLVKGITYTGKAVEKVVKLLTKVVVTALRYINRAYSMAQIIYHYGTMMLSLSTIKEMIEQNQTAGGAGSHLSIAGLRGLAHHLSYYYGGFVERYSQNDVTEHGKKAMERMAAVINETRDPFSLDRDGGWEIPTFLSLPIRTHILDVDIGLTLNRKGGSDLRFANPHGRLSGLNQEKQFYNWSGADTVALDFGVKIKTFGATLIDLDLLSIPFGVGAAQIAVGSFSPKKPFSGGNFNANAKFGFDPYKGDPNRVGGTTVGDKLGGGRVTNILSKVPVIGSKTVGREIGGRKYLEFDPKKMVYLFAQPERVAFKTKSMIHEGFGGDVKTYGYGSSPGSSTPLWGPLPIYLTGAPLPPWVLPQGTPPSIAHALESIAGSIGAPVPVVLVADAVKSPTITIARDGNLGGYKLFRHHDTKLIRHSGHGFNPEAPYITIGLSKSSGRVIEAIRNRSTDIDSYLSPRSEERAEDALTLDDDGAGHMSVLSTAEVYFKRPIDLDYFLRADGRLEYASGFNPFWQARLAQTNEADRQAALRDQQLEMAADATVHSIVDVMEAFGFDL